MLIDMTHVWCKLWYSILCWYIHSSPFVLLHLLFKKNFILFFNFTIMYLFCHISKWILHRHPCVPHPEPSSLLPPNTIPLGCPSAPAPSIQCRALNLDWLLVSYMIFYMSVVTFNVIPSKHKKARKCRWPCSYGAETEIFGDYLALIMTIYAPPTSRTTHGYPLEFWEGPVFLCTFIWCIWMQLTYS